MPCNLYVFLFSIFPSVKKISALELAERIHGDASSRPLLLDVREPWEVKICSIEGSVFVPMGQVPERFVEWDRMHPTVVICHHGMRSLQVVAFLQQQGFTNVHNLVGGVAAWARDVDPAMPVY